MTQTTTTVKPTERKTGLDWAESGLCFSRSLGETDVPAMLFNPDLSDIDTKSWKVLYSVLSRKLKIPITKTVLRTRARVSMYLWLFVTIYKNSLFGAFVKLRKATFSFFMPLCQSVCLHGTTRLDGFSLNFIYMNTFRKICWENSSFIKLWRE
jgi:hypothetical protein